MTGTAPLPVPVPRLFGVNAPDWEAQPTHP
jgi:hypothetical protein